MVLKHLAGKSIEPVKAIGSFQTTNKPILSRYIAFTWLLDNPFFISTLEKLYFLGCATAMKPPNRARKIK
jgi:hypothetical protein